MTLLTIKCQPIVEKPSGYHIHSTHFSIDYSKKIPQNSRSYILIVNFASDNKVTNTCFF